MPASHIFLSIFFSIFILIAFIIVFYLVSKNRETLKMIEKGFNPEGNLSISEFRKQRNLKNGVLLLSLGIGLSIGRFLSLVYEELDNPLTYVIMFLIFGGIGFLISFFILKKSDRK